MVVWKFCSMHSYYMVWRFGSNYPLALIIENFLFLIQQMLSARGVPLDEYISQAFHPSWDVFFRVVSSDALFAQFRSDRSHMIDERTQAFLVPPPPWPTVNEIWEKRHGGEKCSVATNLFSDFLDLSVRLDGSFVGRPEEVAKALMNRTVNLS